MHNGKLWEQNGRYHFILRLTLGAFNIVFLLVLAKRLAVCNTEGLVHKF